MARLIWAQYYKNHFVVSNEGTIIYDFYLRVDEAFYDKQTKKIQEFEFIYNCCENCPVNFSKEIEISSKFLLM